MDTDRALGIYIKGVSEETTEVDLQSTFSQFGAITETVIKGERGWALVQFADSAAAAAAAGAGVTSIGGCQVEVAARTPAKPREPRDVPASVNLYLKGLDEETTRDEVEETLGGFGEVTSVKLRCEPPRSSGFLLPGGFPAAPILPCTPRTAPHRTVLHLTMPPPITVRTAASRSPRWTRWKRPRRQSRPRR